MRNGIRLMAVTAVLAVTAVACGDSGGALTVDDPWARTSAGVQNTGAVYLKISGGGDADTLTAVSVSPDVAAMAQIHETTMGDDGTMKMSPVATISVPADGSVSLQPGGFHVMLMNLAEPLETGATFDLTLTFATAGTITVEVEVRDE